MSQFWSDVVSGLFAGVSTAIFWAIFVFGWTMFRDRKILAEVEKSIVDFPNVGTRRMKLPYSPDPVEITSFSVRNKTPWSIVVRKVELTFEGPVHYTLGYLGKFQTEFDSHVELKAYTASEWGAPFKRQHGNKLTAGCVEIEYKSPLGATRLRIVNLSAQQLQILEDAIVRSHRPENQQRTNGLTSALPSDLGTLGA